MLNKTFLSSAIALSMIANVAIADTYRTEINANFGRTEIDTNPFYDMNKINHSSLSGTYYFGDVSSKNHPLAEAAFLERSSNISLTRSSDRTHFNTGLYDYANNGLGYMGNARVEGTSTFTSADIEFYIPNSIFYVGGGIGEGKLKTRYQARVDGTYESYTLRGDTGSFWSLRGGVTPIEGLLVWSEFYKNQKLKDEWNINTKYVMDWSGNAVNLEAAYNYFHGDDIINLAADFYFDRTFSVGVTYDYHTGAFDDDSYGLRARKFFTEKFAVEAGYGKSDVSDSYNVGVSMRF